VLAEAMLAGVPCIGSSSGAIPDVIGPGGLVFKENNADNLARTLERILVDMELRKSLANTARIYALQNYTLKWTPNLRQLFKWDTVHRNG
jgi:glycosyltransferase involved in cell wall biosynthesis